ncbi:hypothetical protein BGX34_004285 [Mortierella sp. NVP85]|nr:hypothetical protein BGX34_004285 [Mortierella sp. NVP85]
MTSQVPAYVDSDIVKALVEDKSKIPGKDYLIIDVRDDDYVGGHIPGSINYPSQELPERLPELIKAHQDVPDLYFHCALSQVRGPKAARRWSEAVEKNQATQQLTEIEVAQVQAANQSGLTQRIHVLRGGFGQWQQKYKDQGHLLEDYQAEYWTEEY